MSRIFKEKSNKNNSYISETMPMTRLCSATEIQNKVKKKGRMRIDAYSKEFKLATDILLLSVFESGKLLEQ